MPHASNHVGRFEVIPLCDGWAPLPLADECPGQEVDWGIERTRFPWAFAEGDSWAWHVHAFAVRGGRGVVLIDTGIGSFGTPPYDIEGRIEEELGAAGLDPAEVTSVIHTHLHADHAGGACAPSGRPRFPNAVHDVHEADWRFFAASDDPEDFSAYAALAQVFEAGAVHLSGEDAAIAPGITAVHTPGHTPGHRSVLVETATSACCSPATSCTCRPRSSTRRGPRTTTRTRRSRARAEPHGSLALMPRDGGWG